MSKQEDKLVIFQSKAIRRAWSVYQEKPKDTGMYYHAGAWERGIMQVIDETEVLQYKHMCCIVKRWTASNSRNG